MPPLDILNALSMALPCRTDLGVHVPELIALPLSLSDHLGIVGAHLVLELLELARIVHHGLLLLALIRSLERNAVLLELRLDALADHRSAEVELADPVSLELLLLRVERVLVRPLELAQLLLLCKLPLLNLACVLGRKCGELLFELLLFFPDQGGVARTSCGLGVKSE